ncbi:MAG: hypothetical protein ACI4M6_07125 [Christensenellaceae bacterium]
MAKKKYENKQEDHITSSYKLHKDAVDRLVSADDNNVPEVDNKELEKYTSSKLGKIPTWVKAFFVKFWFYGAICFFFFWGLGIYIGTNLIDQIVVSALAIGIFNDVIVNPILRFLDNGDNGYSKWIFIPQKNFLAYFANIIYAFVIVCLVALTYYGQNILINGIKNVTEYNITVGVEPFLFGILCLVYDLIFIGIKQFFAKLISDANKKLSRQAENGAKRK